MVAAVSKQTNAFWLKSSKGKRAHLSTSVRTAGPVHPDWGGNVQARFQLARDVKCPVLGFDQGHTAELAARAGHLGKENQE